MLLILGTFDIGAKSVPTLEQPLPKGLGSCCSYNKSVVVIVYLA